MPELPTDHDCRQRVQSGNATREAVYDRECNIQIKYSCDECHRNVWVILEELNVQIEDDGATFEPGTDVDRSELYEADLHRVS
jgi:hypothetical protein